MSDPSLNEQVYDALRTDGQVRADVRRDVFIPSATGASALVDLAAPHRIERADFGARLFFTYKRAPEHMSWVTFDGTLEDIELLAAELQDFVDLARQGEI